MHSNILFFPSLNNSRKRLKGSHKCIPLSERERKDPTHPLRALPVRALPQLKTSSLTPFAKTVVVQ